MPLSNKWRNSFHLEDGVFFCEVDSVPQDVDHIFINLDYFINESIRMIQSELSSQQPSEKKTPKKDNRSTNFLGPTNHKFINQISQFVVNKIKYYIAKFQPLSSLFLVNGGPESYSTSYFHYRKMKTRINREINLFSRYRSKLDWPSFCEVCYGSKLMKMIFFDVERFTLKGGFGGVERIIYSTSMCEGKVETKIFGSIIHNDFIKEKDKILIVSPTNDWILPFCCFPRYLNIFVQVKKNPFSKNNPLLKKELVYLNKHKLMLGVEKYFTETNPYEVALDLGFLIIFSGNDYLKKPKFLTNPTNLIAKYHEVKLKRGDKENKLVKFNEEGIVYVDIEFLISVLTLNFNTNNNDNVKMNKKLESGFKRAENFIDLALYNLEMYIFGVDTNYEINYFNTQISLHLIISYLMSIKKKKYLTSKKRTQEKYQLFLNYTPVLYYPYNAINKLDDDTKKIFQSLKIRYNLKNNVFNFVKKLMSEAKTQVSVHKLRCFDAKIYLPQKNSKAYQYKQRFVLNNSVVDAKKLKEIHEKERKVPSSFERVKVSVKGNDLENIKKKMNATLKENRYESFFSNSIFSNPRNERSSRSPQKDRKIHSTFSQNQSTQSQYSSFSSPESSKFFNFERNESEKKEEKENSIKLNFSFPSEKERIENKIKSVHAQTQRNQTQKNKTKTSENESKNKKN